MKKWQMKKLKYEFPPVSKGTEERIEKELIRELGYVPKIREKQRINKMVLAYVLVAMLLIGSAFAMVKVSSLKSEKKGKNGLETSIESDGNLTDTIYRVEYSWNYVPEGMRLGEAGKQNFISHSSGEQVTAIDAVYNNENIDRVMKDKNVALSDKIVINGHDAVYLSMNVDNDLNFSQRLYILFPEYSRVIIMFGTENLEKDEFIKMAENCEIRQTDEILKDGEYILWDMFTDVFEDSVVK